MVSIFALQQEGPMFKCSPRVCRGVSKYSGFLTVQGYAVSGVSLTGNSKIAHRCEHECEWFCDRLLAHSHLMVGRINTRPLAYT